MCQHGEFITVCNKAVMHFRKHCKGQHKLKNMCLLGQELKQNQQAVGFILQVESRDPRPSAQLCPGHQRWACRASPGRDLQNICSPWARSHLGWCHRTPCSAPNWLLWLLWRHFGELGQTRHLHLQEWVFRGCLQGRRRHFIQAVCYLD